MAFATGSQIRPELSAVDYTPFLQAAGQSAQMQAQGIAAGVGGALRGFESYVQQQKENKQLEAEVKSAEKLGQALQPFLAQVNPEAGAQVNTLLASVADPNVSLRERSAVAKNIGSALNNILNLAQLGKQTQDQKAAAEYAGLLRSGGGAIPAPISNAALSRFTPEQRLAGEEMFLRGEQVRTGIEKSRAETKKLMAPPAADLTAAQKDTEAIIASEIATGVLNPNDRAAISRRRAQLLSRGGRADRDTERFQSVSAIVDESGNYLGQGVFDQKSGKFGLVNETTGEIEPLPKGAKPSTVSGMSRGMLSAPQFLQLRTKLGQDEIALGRLSEYFDSVEDSRQGIDLLADKITTAVKTLLTTQKLSPTELAQAKSAGELQALLGSTRLEVLGGGVLTENDAVRLILNLGGDVNALRNKEVVRTQLARIYEDKYKTYKRDLEDYNVQIAGGYGAQGYKPAVSIEFDQKLLRTYKSPQAQRRDESIIDSISKRIAELEAKMKSGGSSK